MNSNTHPIDLFIVLMIELIEGISWIINEIAGHHNHGSSATPEDNTQATLTNTKSSNDLDSQTTIKTKTITTSFNEDWMDYVSTLTVRQLRTLTGIKSSRYKKADLQLVAISY